MFLIGSAVNAATIILGSLIGVFGGKFLPERMKNTLLHVCALSAMGAGIPGLMESQKPLVPIISLVLGAIIGELLDIDGAVNHLGDKLQSRFSGRGQIAEGFVTATLVFAVGAMAVMGALNSGLSHDHSILYVKSAIDGVSAVVFAATLGLGVAFSAVPVFLLEGLIALLATFIAPYLNAAVMAEITFTGSLMIVAISLNLLGVTKIKVLNLVPALIFPVFLCMFL